MKVLLTALIMIITINSVSFAESIKSIDSWKDQILYFVLLDRFYDGNKQNCKNINKTDLQAFHGGDIAGLEQKLDYLEELGITGIWISPFLKNRPTAFFGQEAYHGYWPYDFFKIDERFGKEEELLSLRKSMKKKNIRLLLDMVVNHMGYDAPFVKEHKDWFNPMINIENWEEAGIYTDKAIESYSRTLSNIENSNYNTSKTYIILNEIQNAVKIKDKDVFLIKYIGFIEETRKYRE